MRNARHHTTNGQRNRWNVTFLVAAACLLLSAGRGQAEEIELIAVPRFDGVKSQVLDWVARQGVQDEVVRERVGQLWGTPDVTPEPAELFDRTIETFRAVDAATAEFVDACSLMDPALTPPSPEALLSAAESEFYRTNLAQFYGVYLVQRKMHDEALTVFDRVDVKLSADPPAYLFHRAVAEYELLMKDEGLATVEKLLKHTEAVPPRYTTVASLMEYELQALKEASLNEVAMRMKDIERRLSLGRGGPNTQKKEEEVITLLDDIIKKIEQSNSGGSGQGAGGNTNKPGGGAQDSQVKGTTAPGETDSKSLKKQAGWGGLPESEQTRIKHELKINYPAHYRRAKEAYFRKAAGRSSQK